MSRSKSTPSTFAKIITYVVVAAGIILIVVSFASLFYNTGYWYIQALNFPRLQTLLILLFCLVLFVLVQKNRSNAYWAFVIATLASIVLQSYILFPYFPLTKKHIASVKEETVSSGAVFSIMLANVYLKNRQAEKLINIIKQRQPTFIVTMEVNQWWVTQLSGLKSQYPHVINFDTDNSYGMTLYSKIPLQNPEIRFLNHDSVPSFYVSVTLPNGKKFNLVAIHPVAPKPSEHPDNINNKEVALIKVANIVKNYTTPTIVTGDFNDVGWSHNSNRFEEISGLYDVRDGRGLYSTFNAQSFIFRWPLDYVYASHKFKVIEVERLPEFGSDHFPFFVKLALP